MEEQQASTPDGFEDDLDYEEDDPDLVSFSLESRLTMEMEALRERINNLEDQQLEIEDVNGRINNIEQHQFQTDGHFTKAVSVLLELNKRSAQRSNLQETSIQCLQNITGNLVQQALEQNWLIQQLQQQLQDQQRFLARAFYTADAQLTPQQIPRVPPPPLYGNRYEDRHDRRDLRSRDQNRGRGRDRDDGYLDPALRGQHGRPDRSRSRDRDRSRGRN